MVLVERLGDGAVLAGLRDDLCRVLHALVVGERAFDLRPSPQPVHARPVRRDPRPLRPGSVATSLTLTASAKLGRLRPRADSVRSLVEDAWPVGVALCDIASLDQVIDTARFLECPAKAENDKRAFSHSVKYKEF